MYQINTECIEKSQKRLLFVFLLFPIGLHRLYLGRLFSGIAQFILCLGLIGYLWVIFDIYLFISGKLSDSTGKLLRISSEKRDLNNPPACNDNAQIAELDTDGVDAIDLCQILGEDNTHESLLQDDDFINTFEFDKTIFQYQSDGYQLYLDCVISYYNDGKLSKNELKKLLENAEDLLKKDIPDKELVVKEVVLEMLDSLRDSLRQINDPVEKFQIAIYTTKYLSKMMKDGLDKEIEDNRFKEDYIKAIYKSYMDLIKLDREVLSENEKVLLKVIKNELALQ